MQKTRSKKKYETFRDDLTIIPLKTVLLNDKRIANRVVRTFYLFLAKTFIQFKPLSVNVLTNVDIF